MPNKGTFTDLEGEGGDDTLGGVFDVYSKTSRPRSDEHSVKMYVNDLLYNGDAVHKLQRVLTLASCCAHLPNCLLKLGFPGDCGLSGISLLRLSLFVHGLNLAEIQRLRLGR